MHFVTIKISEWSSHLLEGGQGGDVQPKTDMNFIIQNTRFDIQDRFVLPEIVNFGSTPAIVWEQKIYWDLKMLCDYFYNLNALYSG